MGKQFQIYLTPKDIERLEIDLRRVVPYTVLHCKSAKPTPRTFPNLDVKENDRSSLFLFLVQEEELERVVMEEVPAEGYWSVDSLRSPVIEFTKCFFDGSCLRRGRLWFQTGYYGANEEWVEKSSAFVEWANRVFRTVKKCLEREDGYYVGADAKKFRAGGGKFVT